MPADNDRLPEYAEATGAYRVTVYTVNAKPLREYRMDARTDRIGCLEDAVRWIRNKLRLGSPEPLVAIVTEETRTGFNQVQVDLRPTAANLP